MTQRLLDESDSYKTKPTHAYTVNELQSKIKKKPKRNPKLFHRGKFKKKTISLE